jgi:hypothetical protein
VRPRPCRCRRVTSLLSHVVLSFTGRCEQDGFSVNRLGHQAERSVKDLVVDTADILDKDVVSNTEEERMRADVYGRPR